MRRLELLINDVRFNTDNVKTSRYPSIRLMKFFNDAQREIQSMIVTNDEVGKHFIGDDTIDTVTDQEAYDLPSDIFASSYVLSVGYSLDQSQSPHYTPLDQISDKERGTRLGYVLRNSQLLMSPIPATAMTDGLRVDYVRKLYTLSIRIGSIASYISSTSITLAVGFSTETITDYEDYVTVVDSNGVIKQSGIRLTSYAAGVVGTSTALTGIAVGDYVVLGRVASSHSELPDICEGVLTAMVEKAIQRVDASTEFNWADLITQDQKDSILAVFQGADHDSKTPPITNHDYLNY